MHVSKDEIAERGKGRDDQVVKAVNVLRIQIKNDGDVHDSHAELMRARVRLMSL